MPPRSPLPPRHGLQSAWVRTPDRGPGPPLWATMREWLRHKLPDEVPVESMLAAGRFVDDHGRAWTGDEPYRPHTFVWFHRDLREEPPVPGELTILHQDERLVVVDKPHFLSTIPRGRHVTESVVVKARQLLHLPELGPAHRLDRLTAGVLVLTTERRWRAPYQRMFEQRVPVKTYEAIAGCRPDLPLPTVRRSHIVKERGVLTAHEVPGRPPNAETLVELLEARGGLAAYRLRPRTGRTHQLRLHLSALGIPIVGDPLYPTVLPDAVDDFTEPLRLLARTLEFVDPVDGHERRFDSRRELAWPQRP
ncbi:pseudouridine synthase [Arsenicicoccus sp. oral taxon 190]|uniref:pseudouridine synthase n=1 Tax=Arsenicicoccus sp. oral taxon 190 TaxID=1658671 RepID=UPI00067A2AD5|nr:pseudouridine synthase [Arsenicicoccus sp. oral taxon 190]AKT51865.1 pseudouridylate synthase [Arsenicicoccus sp. oral taxon 190]